jgi:hypothetical protein
MAVTKAKCGTNEESQGIAGGEGIADDPVVAQVIALGLYLDAFASADKSLRAFAAQPCPMEGTEAETCPNKVPPNPQPTYTDGSFSLRWDPGAPAKPAVAAKVDAKGKVVTPAQPAVPARPAKWICKVQIKGTVTFVCNRADG